MPSRPAGRRRPRHGEARRRRPARRERRRPRRRPLPLARRLLIEIAGAPTLVGCTAPVACPEASELAPRDVGLRDDLPNTLPDQLRLRAAHAYGRAAKG